MQNGRTVLSKTELLEKLHLFLHGAEGDDGDNGDGPDTGSDNTNSDDTDSSNEDGSGATDGNDEDDDADDSGDDSDSPEVKKLRKENAARRIKNRELEKELAEFKKRDMTEKERAEAEKLEAEERAQTAERALAESRLQMAITSAASGFHDPQDAVNLIDTEAISTNDDGTPNKNSVKAAVEKLAKAKPHLLKPSGPGSGDGGARGNGAGNVGDRKTEYEKEFRNKGGVTVPKL